KIFLLLRLAAVTEQRAHGVHLRMAGGTVAAGRVDFLHDGGGGAHREPAAAVLLRDQRGQKARLGERRHEFVRIGALAVELAPVFAGKIGAQRAHRLADGGEVVVRSGSAQPHTSRAVSTIIASFAHCSSSARILPSSVEAKPHCGLSASCSMSTYLVASSMRRLIASFDSSSPLLEVTRPSTTVLLPFGRKRSGSNPPARSVSYSRK